MYIGETSRSYGIRRKENLGTNSAKSAVVELRTHLDHMANTCICMFNPEDSKILTSEESY